MSVYLDASVLVSLFVEDANSGRAAQLTRARPEAVTSSWGAAEFSSALSKLVRIGRLEPSERDQMESKFEAWTLQIGGLLSIADRDCISARGYVRTSSSGLRSADALHLAVAVRNGLQLATFDVVLAKAAREVGVTVSELTREN